MLLGELRKAGRRQGLWLPGRPESLRRAVRKPADQRASLWRMLQPLRGGRAVRGRGCEGVCPPGEPVCTGCACETVPCTPGTSGCNPSGAHPVGGICYANADGVGTTCACGFSQCTNDCQVCANLGLVCVIEAEFCPGGFQCVGPC